MTWQGDSNARTGSASLGKADPRLRRGPAQVRPEMEVQPMTDPTVPVPGAPKPAPDVNEVRLRLEAISSNAQWATTWPALRTRATLAALAALADSALTFLPAAEPSSEGL